MGEDEIPYPAPDWLKEQLNIIQSLAGYSTASGPEESGPRYAKETDHIAAEYFRVFLEDPQEAPQRIMEFLEKFKSINNKTGILNPVLPEQFGLIANIASLGYEELDKGGRYQVLTGINSFLRNKATSYTSHFSQLRNPEVVLDMVFHWSAANWPDTWDYRVFLETATPATIAQAIQHPSNNPLLLALAAPLGETDGKLREFFLSQYPELSEQGLEIIAARLLNRGAHEEILSGTPNNSVWEESILTGIEEYGEEYRPYLLQRIAGVSVERSIFHEGITFSELFAKLSATFFTISQEGTLIRQEK